MCKIAVKNKLLAKMALPHLTKPSARGRITDPVKAGAVLTLYKGSSRSYSGIAKATGINGQTARDIVHRAEARAQVGEKALLKKLLNNENVDAIPKKPRAEAATAGEKRYLIRIAEVPENRRSTLNKLVEKAGLDIC